MDVQIVIAKDITWPKTDKADRTHDNEFMKQLAMSIRAQGLLEPIGVRPDPGRSAGFYIGVFGEHRCACYVKELKEEGIAAHILDCDTEDEARIISDAENLWRNPLTKQQHQRAMGRWHADYEAKRAAFSAAVAAEKVAAKKVPGRPNKPKTPPVQAQTGPGDEGLLAAEPAEQCTAPSTLPPKPPQNFAEHAAKITGQSESVVKRQVKIAKSFTPAQLDVLEQQGVNQTWMDTIAALKPGVRDAVVNLIASGKNEDDAIAAATGTPEVTRADGKSYEVAASKPGEKAEADMKDDEWVAFHCRDVVSLLEDPAAYTAHAILYRHTRDIRQAFKAKAKKSMGEAKAAGLYGGVYGAINRMITLAHPNKWLRCGTCSGTGIVQDGNKQSKCKDCAGNSFIVKQESK